MKNISASLIWNGVLSALWCILAGIVLMKWPLTGQRLAQLSLDLPYAISSVVPEKDPNNAEVIVFHIDETSRLTHHQDLNPRNWDRHLHARVIQQLNEWGASAIVFGLLFDQSSKSSPADTAFANALKNSRAPVILAAHRLDSQPGLVKEWDKTHLIKPLEQFREDSFWGVMSQPISGDGRMRRHYFDSDFPNLAWRTATILRRTPEPFDGNEWINPYGEILPFREFSYSRILGSNAISAELISGKVVIIGQGKFFAPTEILPPPVIGTSWTRWHGGEHLPATAHAIILSNLLRSDWLIEGGLAWDWFILIFAGCLAGAYLNSQHLPRLMAQAVAFAIAIFLVAIVLHHYTHFWILWAVPVFVQLPVAVIWNLWLGLQQEPLFDDNQILPTVEVGSNINTSNAVSTQNIGPTTSTNTSRTIKLHDHDLLGIIGKGNYGEVWLGRNPVGILHAVKIIRRNSFSSVEPYEREFEGIRKFMPHSRSHCGLIDILHVGRDDENGFFHYIMELGDDQKGGEFNSVTSYCAHTLSQDLLNKQRLGVSNCLDIGLVLSGALAYLHANNLTHRDIKPSNVVYVNGIPKLADIGLVTDISSSEENRTYVGTEGYIPPEGPGTAVSDIYSLGKVLYEACMGRSRLDFPDLPSTVVQKPTMKDHKERFLFNEILLKACEHDSTRRYASALELHSDLAKLKAMLDCYEK